MPRAVVGKRRTRRQAAANLESPQEVSSLFEFPPRWTPFPLRRKKETKNEEESATPSTISQTTTLVPNLKITLPVLSKEDQAKMNDMTLGAIVSIGVIYALAVEGDPNLEFVDSVNVAAANVVDTALPATTYEVVSVALGETLAGLTGAIASLGLNLLLVNTRRILNDRRRQIEQAQTLINEAVAESDYFLARAAVLPILEGAGLPVGLATIASSLFATFPYELVKMGKMKRTARQEENDMLEELLYQQQQEEATTQSRWSMQGMVRNLRLGSPKEELSPVDPSTLKPLMPNDTYSIDGVELFADTCKWLAYAVLMKDFKGTMTWNGQPLVSGLESGFYGLLATLTSQIYSDFLYFTANAGPVAKQEKVKARTPQEWIQLYISKSISAFTLFSVYSAVQVPVRIAVNALLSGSIDSCIGSTEIDMCMETYYTQNPPGADVGAQLRAVATTIYSFSQIPAEALDFQNQASAEAQIRAIITTLVSLMNRLM